MAPFLHLLPSGEQNLTGDKSLYFKVAVPLYRAATRGDWVAANTLMEKHPKHKLLTAAITEEYETMLHVAAGARQRHFVRNLVDMISLEDLRVVKDKKGNTAFCHAVAVGDIEMVKYMYNKNKALLQERGVNGVTPLYFAALFGHGQMTSYLYSLYKPLANYLTDLDVEHVFFMCLEFDLYDTALELSTKHATLLATARHPKNQRTALHLLAQKPSAFSNSKFRTCMNLIRINGGSKQCTTLEIVENLWCEMLKLNLENLRAVINTPTRVLFDAAESGNIQLITKLIRSYPNLIWETNERNWTIFHVAVLHRREEVFTLIHTTGLMQQVVTTYLDTEGNTILHLAAKLPKQHNRLNVDHGAALQMQSELLWFKEVEKLTEPSFRKHKKNEDQMAYDLFVNDHQQLMEKGEKWMKKTAQSCMIVTTLIATVVFTVAFSVPGGYDQNTGIPLRLNTAAFGAFIVSDAIALSTSMISNFLFLSILISHYSVQGFLVALPIKLMSGLIMLYISMVSMIIAFAMSFILAYQNGLKFIPALATMLAALPAILYGFILCPLFSYVLHSLYRLNMLFRSSDHFLK